jgi:hypothetical protein
MARNETGEAIDHQSHEYKLEFSSIRNGKSGGAQTVAMELRKHEFLQIRTQILSRTLAPRNSLEAFLSPVQRQMIV